MRPHGALVLSAFLMLGAPQALGGALPGPVIGAVDWDAATYRPGHQPIMTVTLKTPTAAGTIDAMLADGDGVERASPAAQTLPAMANSRQVRFTFVIPADDFRGYHVTINARDKQGRLVDQASGAFDIATDWSRFPRYCFITGSSVTNGSPIRSIVDNLSSYRCNAIQWYDVNWKHHLPYSPAANWPTISGQRIDRAVLQAGLQRAHALGMMNFDYALWNGAWAGYATDGSGAKTEWGLFRRRCLPHCSEADQVSHGPFPAGWATPRLFQMNAADPAWQSYWIAHERAVLDNLPYDGVQIDTLGDPGAVTDMAGRSVDLRQAMPGFANRVARESGKHVVFNAVSQWGLDGVVKHANVDVVYTELHPEFGNIPFLPGLNGLADTIRRDTRRSIVIAAYDESDLARQPACHTSGGKRICAFTAPGVEHLDAQAVASGLDHWELGDVNDRCPVRQAKLASNIYIPGPALCMDAGLQGWEQDVHNFAVSYEAWLRDGVRDAPDIRAAVSGLPAGITASTTGAAGTVYTLPKRRGDSVILHLLNYAALSSIGLDDRDGSAKPGIPLRDVQISLPAGILGHPRIWLASPDIEHGRAQPVAYRCEAGLIRFAVPLLVNWTMIVLQHQDLTSGSSGACNTPPGTDQERLLHDGRQ